MRENKNDPKKIYCLNLLKSLSVTRQIDFQMKEAINRWLIILFVVFAIILSPMISRSPIISMSKASEKEANSVSLQIKDKAREGQLAKGLPQMKGRESVMVQVESEGSEVIFLNYSLPLPKLALLDEKIEGKTVKRLILGNAPNTGHEGEPELPVIPSKVIIPAHRSIAKIDVIRGEKIALPGEHFIEYAKAIYPLIPNVEIKKIGPKNAIYNSDNGFPRKSHYFVGVQKKYGVSVAIVNLFPITYHPKSGKVYYYKNISLKITTEPDASIIKSGIRNRLEKFDSIKFGVENPETLNSYRKKEEEIPLPAGSFNALDSYQYVLITSETIRDADTDVTVHDLIAQKQSRGLTAAIVTIEEIYDSFSGIDNAEKLRNGIIWFYNNWETDYVLLGGDINIIPMRKLWCQAYAGGEADNIPSDLYFQCLDGSYNSDGDSRWGEPDDGQDIPGGNGDVDLMAELFIGRASAENAEEMSNFVYKTIAYENESPAEPYLRHALMAGEHLGFGGDSEYAKLSMEEIRLGSDAHGYTTAGFAASPLFIVDTLYDADGTWPKSEIIADINSNEYSIFNHLGHANDHYVMKFYNADADALTNTNFLFAYSQGCIPGNFEVDCIGEHLTTTHRHGMFAVVFNSRYGWGRHNSTAGPSQLFDRQFWDAYFGEYILNLGAMNASSHEDNLWDINGDCIRWCYYETNLLGDPHTTIHGLAIGPLLAYDLHTHDDSAGGNSDGIINPGEEIDLTVTLINIGSEDAISVSATLSTEDDYITITDNSAEFGDILCCGARKKALDSYIFNVDPNCPSTHNATFELLITDANSESWSSEFI
ncbi:MAG: C25 family cysteine peptidase, partial [bacterium]